MRRMHVQPFRGLLATLALAAFVAPGVQAGEKIRFSGRSSAAAGQTNAAPARPDFDAPDFLGASRLRKDPLDEFTPVQPAPRTVSARVRDKDKKGDRDDSEDRNSDSRERKRTDEDDNEMTRDERSSDDDLRESSRNQREQEQVMRTRDIHGREGEYSSASTNRFRFGERDTGTRERGAFGARTETGSGFNQGAGGTGVTMQVPLSPGSGMAGKGGFLSFTSRGADGQGGADASVNPGNGRQMRVSGFGNTSLPSYMRRDQPPAINRPAEGSGVFGGKQRGPLDTGGSFSSALGGAPANLNDFNNVAGFGGANASAPSAPPADPPRFERKPAVLELPKRKL